MKDTLDIKPLSLLEVILFLLLFSCSSNNDMNDVEQEDNISDVKQIVTIQYGEYLDQNIDVYYNRNDSPQPVIVFVHGGAWCSGDKSIFDEGIVDFFLNKGYVCASVNYRLSPYPVDYSSVAAYRHPTHITDICKAYNWICNNIADYGGDNKNISLLGHSAGAHLVALLVSNTKYLNGENAVADNITKVFVMDGGGYLSMDKELLDENQTLKNYILNALSDYSESTIKDFSPTYSLQPNLYMPSMYLVHSDDSYRAKGNSAYYNRLKEFGYDVHEYILNGYSHSDVLYLIPYYWDEKIEQFE